MYEKSEILSNIFYLSVNKSVVYQPTSKYEICRFAQFNHIALKMAITPLSLDHSECNRVNHRIEIDVKTTFDSHLNLFTNIKKHTLHMPFPGGPTKTHFWC